MNIIDAIGLNIKIVGGGAIIQTSSLFIHPVLVRFRIKMPPMKNIKNPENLSAFLQSAVELDQRFNEILSMSVQLENADLETEFGFHQARKILARFGESGEKIGDAVQNLAQNLQEAKTLVEATTQKIMVRAQ